MQFYLTLSRGHKLGVSPFPHIEEGDRPDNQLIAVLKPGLPLNMVKAVMERWQDKPCDRDKIILQLSRTLNLRAGQILTWEPYISGQWAKSPAKLGEKTEPRIQSGQHIFLEQLRGRQLTEDELRSYGKGCGLTEEESLQLAHKLVLKKEGIWVPAMVKERWGWQCMRCGSREIEGWPAWFGEGASCPHCASLGKISSSQALYRDGRSLGTGGEKAKGVYIPQWELTIAQASAAQEALNFYRNAQYIKGLVWAACGAGKTEVCFPLLEVALKAGKCILVAAPRQDVIHDIAPRIAKNFPQTCFQLHTGAVSNKLQEGQLVLATTHQVLRFYRAFDLIILDEMDAFPYRDNEMLMWGIAHALKPTGKLLCLTATPTRQILNEVKKGKQCLISLPARHHRHPLPVPTWRRMKIEEPFEGAWSKIKSEVERMTKAGPTLLFVPLISWVVPWVERINKESPQLKVSGSYSSDPERAQKIAGLKAGKWEVFVTTSILERGVTLTGAQVIVLAADHPVFDERCLVQMAGRAGRSKSQPKGEVIFLSAHCGQNIKAAIHWIKEQNRQAAIQGLLDQF